MAGNAPNFQDRNWECAKAFLQNAVIVDNGLYLLDDERARSDIKAEAEKITLETPDPRKIKKTKTAPPAEAPVLREPVRDISARTLVDSFADLEIICCPYRPENNAKLDEVVERTLCVARNADIVVIDWDLGEGSDKAVEIIKRIYAEDKAKGGRLRLIAIYTGEKTIDAHHDTLLAELDASDAGDDSYAIQLDHCRIIFVNKVMDFDPIEGVPAVKVDKLPAHLVDEFTKMTDGLMPNVALASITAVREATHHILAKFDGSLDPALLTHRALLVDTEEAEQFVVDLVSDEIDAILEASDIGGQQFGMESIKLWLDDRTINCGLKIGLSDTSDDRFDVAEISKLLKKGLNEARTIKEKKGGKTIKKEYIEKGTHFRQFHNLFAGTTSKRDSAHSRISRYSVTKREAHGKPYIPSNWAPVLTLGTVFALYKDDGEASYRLCIQPICDSVRVKKEGKKFPFLSMTAVNARPGSMTSHDIVITSNLGENLYLEINYKAHQQELITFRPAEGDTVIRAKKNKEGKFYFEGPSRKRYFWLGDLKDIVAIRDADRISAALRRVGMGEFEWLRVRSSHS